MIRIQASADVTQTLKQLASLDDKVAKTVIRQSVNAGGKVAVAKAKSICPIQDTKQALQSAKATGKVGRASFSAEKKGRVRIVRYRGGQLRKSLGQKIKNYSKTKTSVAIVGPRTGFRKQIGVYVKGGSKHRAGEPIIIDPVKYAHLVQRGTKTSPPQDFLSPAARDGAKVAGSVMSILTDRAIQEAARS